MLLKDKSDTNERKLSNCCGAHPISQESDICSECGEHAEFLTEDELENS